MGKLMVRQGGIIYGVAVGYRVCRDAHVSVYNNRKTNHEITSEAQYGDCEVFEEVLQTSSSEAIRPRCFQTRVKSLLRIFETL